MVKLTFYVDGEDCGADVWPEAPRVGDTISFSSDHPLRGNFRVTEIGWKLNSLAVGDVVVHVHLQEATGDTK